MIEMIEMIELTNNEMKMELEWVIVRMGTREKHVLYMCSSYNANNRFR